jgi:anti-sigma-K factor RskA
MTLDHSLVEELMAADALGGLDDDDMALLLAERTAHGDCAECRAIEAGFAETASRLAFALTPAPIDDSMIERIVSSPREERLAPVAAATAGRSDELSERRARRPRAWQALAAAAVVAAVLIVSVGTFAPSTTGVSLVVSASQRVVTFEGNETEATLAVAYTPGEPGAVFWGSGLPDPGTGAVYEIWMIEDGEPTSGGCVVPTDGVVALAVDASIGSSESMAVTNESSDCPASPTGPPIFSADLTTVL